MKGPAMEDVVLSDVKRMSKEEMSQAKMRVAMQSVEHLKRWLEASGRRWLVFPAMELVDALPWPSGVEALMQIVAAYRDHRAAIPSGRTEKIFDPVSHEELVIPVMKGETLEVAELDRAIRYLIGQITERDSSWKLENPPM